MHPLPRTQTPPVALGMLSLVLGAIGLLLFFLPVLGVPVSVCGLAFAVLGTVLGLFGGGVSLRWSLLGVAVCALALATNLAIAYAPGGYLPDPHILPPWQPVPDRPFVPPPAAPL